MNLRTFRGRTLEAAREAATAALGEDAVVVSSRRVPRGGIVGVLGMTDVEVTVAPGDGPSNAGPAPAPLQTRLTPSPDDVSSLRTELHQELRSLKGAAENGTAKTPELEAELAALRAAVEKLGEPDLVPRANAIARFVRDTGLEGRAAGAITKALRAAPVGPLRELLRDAIADLVTVAPWPLADDGPLLITMVGPAGVGKTTTAAKLGAQAIIEQERSVAFVSCDGFRVGAFEQLERFAALLGATVHAAQSPAEFRHVLETETAAVVIVDTAGLPPDAQDVIPLTAAEPKGRRSRAKPVTRARHTLLTLPAALRAVDAQRISKDYAIYAPTALAITKQDDTSSPVGLVHGPVATGLAISVLCAGQRVPEDISPATSGAILDALVPRGRPRDA
jgi:flagellar biosynthesis protein FlhF